MRQVKKIHKLDTIGELCPIPIVKLGQLIREIQQGEVVQLLSDDPGIEIDIPAWCSANRHRILREEKKGAVFIYWIEKR